jgi:hypothetical protein
VVISCGPEPALALIGDEIIEAELPKLAVVDLVAPATP